MVFQLALAQALRKDCQAVVAVIENRGNPHRELVEACAARGIETAVIPCRGQLDRAAVGELRRVLDERRIDLLHTHGYKANIYSRFAASRWRGTLVATCHNWPGRTPRMKFYAFLDQQLLRGFHRVAAVSEEVKRKIPNAGAGRVQVIRNGVSLEPFDRTQDERSRQRVARRDEGRVVVGFVGRLTDDKGARLLLEACRNISATFPRVSLLMVGDGAQRAQYETEFRSEKVLYAGFRREARRCYGCMDIFALPSYAEGLPMTILEAMAAGLPVVATRIGQIPEVVEDGRTGILVEPGDREGLSEALCLLIGNPEESARMGARGYAGVVANYSAERMAEAYQRLYQEAAACALAQPAAAAQGAGASPRVTGQSH